MEAAGHVTLTAKFKPRAPIANALFRCPIDDTRAAVIGFTFRCASRGDVVAQVGAAAATPASLGAGFAVPHRPTTVQRDMFQLSLGALAAEDVTFTLTYVQELPVAGPSILLTIPQHATFPACVAAAAGHTEEATAPGDCVSVRVNFAASQPVAPACTTHEDASVTRSDPAHGTVADPPCDNDGDSAMMDEAKTSGPEATSLHQATVVWSGAAGLTTNLVCTFALPADWVPAAVVQEAEAQTPGGNTDPADHTTAPPLARTPAPATSAVMVPIMPTSPNAGTDTRPGDAPPHDVAGAGAGSVAAGGAAAVASATPPPAAQVIFVVDRSGSMSGSKMAAVRQCMTALLAELPTTASFDIISFGSRFESMFRTCKPATAAAVASATTAVEAMGSDMGGTNLMDPLKFVYGSSDVGHDATKKGKGPTIGAPGSPKSQPQYLNPVLPVQIIVLTDGRVDSGRSDIIQLVRANATRSRCFTFGIGRDVDGRLVKSMAFAGHGRCAFVGHKDVLQKQAARRLARALQRTWYGITVEWPGGTDDGGDGARTQVPRQIPPMFHGEAEPVYLMGPRGLLGHGTPAAASLGVSYTCDGVAARIVVPVIRATGLPQGTLVRLAARARIKEHETSGQASTAVRRHVSPLSLSYGLASPFMSMTLRGMSAGSSVHTEPREGAAVSTLGRSATYNVSYTGFSDSDSGDEADLIATPHLTASFLARERTMSSTMRTVSWHSRGVMSTPVAWNEPAPPAHHRSAPQRRMSLGRSRSLSCQTVWDQMSAMGAGAGAGSDVGSPRIPRPAPPPPATPRLARAPLCSASARPGGATSFSAVKSGLSALAGAVTRVAEGQGHTLDVEAVFRLQRSNGSFVPSTALHQALFGNGALAASVPRLDMRMFVPSFAVPSIDDAGATAAHPDGVVVDHDCYVATAVAACITQHYYDAAGVQPPAAVATQLQRARGWLSSRGPDPTDSATLFAFVFAVHSQQGHRFLQMWTKSAPRAQGTPAAAASAPSAAAVIVASSAATCTSE